LFDTTKIASQAKKRAEEIERQDKIWFYYQRITAVFTLCIICFGILAYVFLSNSIVPANDDINIEPMPIPLASPPTESQISDNTYICPTCGNEIHKTD